MNSAFAHLMISGLLMVAVVLGLSHAGLLAGASRLKRGLLAGVAILVVLVIFNLIWFSG